MKSRKLFAAMFVAGLFGSLAPTYAGEKEIGDPIVINGLQVAAVYLQPVKNVSDGIHDHQYGHTSGSGYSGCAR